jgi:prophage antirepressor-like protein
MMNNLQEFNFKGNNVRTVQIDNAPYFVGNDITNTLKYKNGRKAISDHVDVEDVREERIVTPSGIQKMKVINESGLYSLILSSKLPTAKEFKRWVTSEVLPTIRKHGAYLTDSAIEQTLTDPDYLIKLATQLKTEREGRLIAEETVKDLKPKASYYDKVLSNPSLMNITAIAKDYGYGAITFNKLLHELKIQYCQSGTWYLYSKYQDRGWTQSKTFPYKGASGNGSNVQTKWTQKGRLGLYKELKKHGIVPKIEQLSMEV